MTAFNKKARITKILNVLRGSLFLKNAKLSLLLQFLTEE